MGATSSSIGVEFNNRTERPSMRSATAWSYSRAASRGQYVAIRTTGNSKGCSSFRPTTQRAAPRVGGQRVKAGDVIAWSATRAGRQRHLHLEIQRTVDSVPLIVDQPAVPDVHGEPGALDPSAAGTGIVAGVWTPGRPAPQVRVYGLVKAERRRRRTPSRTYGEHNHRTGLSRALRVSDVEPANTRWVAYGA